MSDRYQAAYRHAPWMSFLVLAVALLLGWLAFEALFDSDRFAAELAGSRRGRAFAGLPPWLLALLLLGVLLLMVVPYLLTVRAARQGRTLVEVGPDGIARHGLLGGVARLPWEDVGASTIQRNMATFRRRAGAPGPSQVAVQLIGQDRAAFWTAVRRFRPDLAPPA